MKELHVAIIGQGRSGRDIHGQYFNSIFNKGRFKVVAVVDTIEIRRNRAAKEYGCDVYADYRDLFGRTDIDFVLNSTFSNMHAPISLDLLEHGFNVVSEKPLCRYVEEVDKLIEARDRTGKMFTVFQQSRFAPYFEQIKKIIDSGVLGEIIQISIRYNGFARRWDWQTLQSFYGGGLQNSGPHPLDQALNLIDIYDGMPNVFCKMGCANTYGDADDYCKLILTSPGKPLIDMEVSSCDAYSDFTFKIQASRGGLKSTQTDIEWKYFSYDEASERHLIKESLTMPDGAPAYCVDDLRWYNEKWFIETAGAFDIATNKYYTMIYDYLTEGKPLLITAEQVRQQIAVVEECKRQSPLPVKF